MRLRHPLLALLAVIAWAPATNAHASIATAEILYVHYDGQQYDVWTVERDGTNRAAVAGAATPSLEHMPELSPRGDMLAFEARYEGDGADAGVYVKNLTSGAVTRVAAADGLFEGPTGWYLDADGVQHLVFVRARDTTGLLYDAWETVPGTGVERQLTNLGGSVMAVRVHGNELVFQHGPQHGSADSDICVAPLPAGAPATQRACLTTGPATDTFPTVAPNGDVVFARTAAGKHTLVRLTRSSGRTTTLATPSSLKGVGYPALSPDGATLAFAGGTSTNLNSYDIWVMPVAGGRAKNLTPVAGTDYVPSWRR